MSTTTSFDTKHEDLIHDAQLDFYGKRLATCSSDQKIRIFEVADGQQKFQTELVGHAGPVWQVCWAHPKFGRKLASCSYDHKVIVWEEVNGKWKDIYQYSHLSSVNGIAFAPKELGLIIASVSSDRSVKVVEYDFQASKWNCQEIKDAHGISCNSISWAPSANLSSLTNSNQQSLVRKFVTGGADNTARIWTRDDLGKWKMEDELKGHSDWVRGVAWAPSIGLPYHTIATCSQDRTVNIWTNDGNGWIKKQLHHSQQQKKFPAVCWSVSWNVTGNILAVSCADNQVSLWKETSEGQYSKFKQMSSGPQKA